MTAPTDWATAVAASSPAGRPATRAQRSSYVEQTGTDVVAVEASLRRRPPHPRTIGQVSGPCRQPGGDPLGTQHHGPEQRRAPRATAQTASMARSVHVGGRWVMSTRSTPNGNSQVTNVVATP